MRYICLLVMLLSFGLCLTPIFSNGELIGYQDEDEHSTTIYTADMAVVARTFKSEPNAIYSEDNSNIISVETNRDEEIEE